MTGVANSINSLRKMALMKLFVECEVVELVKDVWRNCLEQKLLKRDEDLPPHIESSLEVIVPVS